MKRSHLIGLQKKVLKRIKTAMPHLNLSWQDIEVAWYGLDDNKTRVGLITLFNEERYCGKLIVLLPKWECPAHHHKAGKDNDKDESFFVISGKLFVEVVNESGTIIDKTVLSPGETAHLPVGSIHQLHCGLKGAVFLEFSSRDVWGDYFLNKNIVWDPESLVEEDVSKKPREPNILGEKGKRFLQR